MTPNLERFKGLYPEVDYQSLMAHMTEQSHPRRKLKALQKAGVLIRLKKGFYVFSNEFLGKSYSPQIVANLLYGPSYVSLESALAFYNLIPERVSAWTSVTTQKNKAFVTPIGTFTYTHLAETIYPFGVTLKSSSDERTFLIASPEKALMDVFTLRFKNSAMPSKSDLVIALEEDLRIDTKELKTIISINKIQQMKPFYRNRRWNKLLIDYLLERK